VPRGSVFGLLGPNGAGKTTTIGAMTTRVLPTAGKVTIAGIDVARNPAGARRHLAVVPQRNNLDRSLTARQNLVYHAAYFGVPRRERTKRADKLLEQFGLMDRAKDRPGMYSGGMAQRLMIARALMHDPDILFLDEPSTGLDPQSRLFVYERITDLHNSGMTVLITTHDMDEAERLCTHVGIVDKGKVLALDTPDALRATIPGANSLDLEVSFPALTPRSPESMAAFAALMQSFEALPGVTAVERVAAAPPAMMGPPPGAFGPFAPPPPAAAPPGGPEVSFGPPRIRLYTVDSTALVAPAISLAVQQGAIIKDLKMQRASLEDVFIQLTGKALR
jgi:ABC-2 type transport system ATP-binding protein